MLLNSTNAWKYHLSLQAVLHAPAAGAEWDVGGGQHSLGLAVLSHLRNGVNDATDETDKDGRHTAKSDGCIEEDESTKSNRELVQGSYHGVCCRRSHTHSPGGGIRDENGRQAGDDHDHDDSVALLRRKVLLDVRRGPVFDENRGNKQDGNGEEVVVVHSCLKLVLRFSVRKGHVLS